MVEFVLKFLMIFGLPLLFLIFAIIILVNVLIVPCIKTGRDKKIIEGAAIVVDKREFIKSNANGFISEFYVTFLFSNKERFELKCGKSLYKKVNIDDKGKLTYKPSVEIADSFQITEKSSKKTKGRGEASYLFSGDGVYRQ